MKLLAILSLLVVSLVTASGLRIFGGYFDVYDIRSINHSGARLQFGDTDTAKNGTQSITFAQCYCKNTFTDARGFCHQRLIVSTGSEPNGSHFEILGSYEVIHDMDHTAISETINRVGVQVAGSHMRDMIVADCEVWNSVTNQWGYGYLHFIIGATDRAPLTDVLSYQWHNADNRSTTLAEHWLPSKSISPGSVKRKLAEVRSWTSTWGTNTIKYLYLWRFENTEMTDATLVYEDAEMISFREIPRRSIVLDNLDPVTVTEHLPELSTSAFHVSSNARLTSAFDFPFNVSGAIGVHITSIGPSMGTSLYFEFSSPEELYETHFERENTSVKWPGICPSGTRITYNITVVEETQKIPMRFVFRRGAEDWTETVDILATLRALKVTSSSCCLYEHTIENPCQYLPECG